MRKLNLGMFSGGYAAHCLVSIQQIDCWRPGPIQLVR
ncbi:uncharacterized protein METZ01_LOCUS90422 [marine metagenome]|uniref:Uncharacterized protein n=1 Tax=marine metagenome TaxID=408172 RepID=A0A381VCR8_9ZZZZ